MKKNGFTLIELLIGITILSIIMAMTVSLINVEGQESVSKADALYSELSNIDTSLNYYKEARGHYPIPSSSCANPANLNSTCLPDFIPYFMVGSPLTYNIDSKLFSDKYYLYSYDNNTGKAYVCVKFASSENKYAQTLIQIVLRKAPEGQLIVDTKCGSDTNNLDYSVPLSITWWLSK